MKDGVGPNPFDEDLEEDSGGLDEDSVVEQGEPVNDVDSGNDGGPGWRAKESAKSRRDMVQFFLQDSTKDAEGEFKGKVEDIAGFDVYTTDLREAAYLVAMEHPEEVAQKLEEWGCEFA